MAFTDIKLLDENGNSYGVKHIENRIRTSSVPYYTDISGGKISGHTSIEVQGEADTLSNTSYDTIWNVGGLLTYLSAAEQLYIVSDNANDTSAGTGARTIKLYGLDTNWNEITETITMNGITPVLSVNSYLRLFKAEVETVGSDTSQTNIGNITIKNNAQTITLSQISAGDGQTLNSFWTVPAGKTFNLLAFYASAMKGKNLSIRMYIRENGKAFKTIRNIAIKDGSFIHQKRLQIKIPEKTDIEYRGIAKEISGGGFVSAGFDGYTE